jgi:hypothetical protein
MENLTVIVVVCGLSALCLGQWLLIWRLTDRLLMQARLPTLGPVLTTPPEAPTPVVPQRRRVMSVEVPD